MVPSSRSQPTQVISVSVLHTLHDAFDYHIEDPPPKVGARVRVPFRNQSKVGVVLSIDQPPSRFQTKPVSAVIDDTPIIPQDILSLCHWVSQYYQSPMSEVLALVLPKKYREGQAMGLAEEARYQLVCSKQLALEKLSKVAHKQIRLLEAFTEETPHKNLSELQAMGFSKPIIQKLVDKSILKEKRSVQPCANPSKKPDLNQQQKEAVKAIAHHRQGYQCFLLYGVTGSGKTEVYMRALENVLSQGKQALIIVPEIGLTPQLVERFRHRFTKPLVVIHSRLNDTERQQAWQLAHSNIAKIVIGTRTAVFTPMPSLGILIIDEEHDASLKQMEGVRYSARDTALVRAHQQNIPVVLGSATPSLESLQNAYTGKYQLLPLKEKALASHPLTFHVTDIRNQYLNHGLSESTLSAIQAELKQNHQVMIFINRRGYAPVLLCHACGWMADCRACDSHLTLHQKKQRLICHHCGLTQKIPSTCKSCQGADLIPVGAGTQRIAEYLTHHFPETTVLRIDKDKVQKKGALGEQLNKISQGEAQIVVGTQMLAKGHHFPNLTLVIILDADVGLYHHDFRALERFGQLITQVSGRAGRAHKAGQVIIQTHYPQHPMLNKLIQEGYEPFAESLLQTRQEAMLPPSQHIALVRAESKSLQKVLTFLHQSKIQLTQDRLVTLGPAPAPLARKAHYHRLQLLVRSDSRAKLQKALTELRHWLTMHRMTSGIRWNIDVDPVDLS